eukprot:scaffold167_cov110-Cylindrotheca_fusiformis.AAC.9
MKLSLFRRLVMGSPHGRNKISIQEQISQIASNNYDEKSSLFQGIELCCSDIDENILDLSRSLDLGVLCRIVPVDVDDACRKLDQLSTMLMKTSSIDTQETIRLVVIEQPRAAAAAEASGANEKNDDGIEYLTQLLPLAAQFMEVHPTIGKSKGEMNAHGKPLDTHVVGVCHRLQSLPTISRESDNTGLTDASMKMLSYFCEILDVLPPTRLSWDFPNELAFNSEIEDELGIDMEPLIQSVDHIDFSNYIPNVARVFQKQENQNGELFHHVVWQWQRSVQIQETYASCNDLAAAAKIRMMFQEKPNQSTINTF